MTALNNLDSSDGKGSVNVYTCGTFDGLIWFDGLDAYIKIKRKDDEQGSRKHEGNRGKGGNAVEG